MSDDVGDGTLAFSDDTVRVDWPAVGDLPIFDHNADTLDALSRHARRVRGQPRVVAHAARGTGHRPPARRVRHGRRRDHRRRRPPRRVFAGEGSEVHDGLLVTDGAIVPRPLAVNPLLTISALSERAIELLAAEKGWTISAGPTPPLPPTPAAPTPGLRFTERMAGWAGPAPDGDPQSGALQGEADGTRLEFVLTIDIDDLPAMLDDPATPAG